MSYYHLAGVDFNIEAADDIEDGSSPAYLDSLAPLGVPETVSNSFDAEHPEVDSANENVVPNVVVNGLATPSSPSTVRKKRPYIRRSIPKSEGPVVKLLKLSPNTIKKHTNGEMNPPPVPVPPELEPCGPVETSPDKELIAMSVPIPVPKKRTVNGPSLLRNKQVKKKVVGKSKAVYRKPGEPINRTSVAGVKPLDSPVEESGLVECVKCSAVVSIESARDHLSVCGAVISPPVEENTIGTRVVLLWIYLTTGLIYFSISVPPSPVESIPVVTPLGPPPPLPLLSSLSPSKGYGTRASSIRSVQSTYGPDACGLCGARGLSDGLSRYLHAHLHHQRHACLVCGSMHAKVSALVKHLQAVHGKEDR